MQLAQTQPTTPLTLSARLREETRDAHRLAERGPFIRRLLRGAVSRRDYASFLAALRRLYAALEAGLLAHHEHPCVAPLCWPALWRVAAIDRDLAALLGPEWRAQVALDRYADRHVARLTTLALADPPLLVGHAYTRYLGDLSGGQILRGAVRSFAPDAVALYEFAGLEAAAAAREFRARLDALPLAPRVAAAVVAEARHAFELHVEMTAALPEAG